METGLSCTQIRGIFDKFLENKCLLLFTSEILVKDFSLIFMFYSTNIYFRLLLNRLSFSLA